MLEMELISKFYSGPDGDVRAVSAASLEVGAGELVTVCGPSGCGKTTLLMIAGALLSPSEGRVRVDGTDPYGVSPGERARLRAEKVGFVFQQFHLIPYLSVRDNVLAASVPNPQPDSAERAEALVRELGLEPRIHHLPSELSTGERQRTALARALLNRPALLLADEPTGNLDESNVDILFGHLNRYVADGGCVLLATHDNRIAAHATRQLNMRDGALEA